MNFSKWVFQAKKLLHGFMVHTGWILVSTRVTYFSNIAIFLNNNNGNNNNGNILFHMWCGWDQLRRQRTTEASCVPKSFSFFLISPFVVGKLDGSYEEECLFIKGKRDCTASPTTSISAECRLTMICKEPLKPLHLRINDDLRAIIIITISDFTWTCRFSWII